MTKAARRRRKNAKSKRKTRATGPTRAASRPTSTRTARPAARATTGATRATKAAGRPSSRLIAPWWERHPGRLEWELQQLEAKGLQAQIDAESRQKGQIVLQVSGPVAGGEHSFAVIFPDSYPELRAEVYAETLNLDRHQHAFRKNLCLLDRNTEEWGPTDSVAWLLTDRVPRLLELLKDPEELQRAEAPQGEPFSNYYTYQPGGVLLIPKDALALQPQHGVCWMQLRPESGSDSRPLRALLARVNDSKGRILARAERELADIYTEQAITGRWLRLNEPPSAQDGPSMIQSLSQHAPELAKPHWQNVHGLRLDVVGVVFPEEIRQGQFEDAWLAVVREGNGAAYLCRGQRVTEEDFLARVPELTPLRRCTIGVIGLGGLGAPSALEFARCQVGELRFADGDIVEAGTAVRWPFGLTEAGRLKAETMFRFIHRNHPFTRVAGYSLRLGSAEVRKRGRSERELLSEFLDGLDLVYDATAERGVQYLLSNLARDWEVPQIYVSGTEGGWGGMVTRCIPGKTGCWLCWKYHLDDGSLPLPSLQPGGTTQPRGCATRTFTGTGFDLMPIVAQGVRLAVQTLGGRSASAEPRYPASDHDISILYLRDAKGNPAGCPRWEHYKLEIHPRCEFCAKT